AGGAQPQVECRQSRRRAPLRPRQGDRGPRSKGSRGGNRGPASGTRERARRRLARPQGPDGERLVSPGEPTEKSVVLIVDDDTTMRFLMRETLEQDGFTVVESGDGVEALQAYEETRPEMLISDVVMPRMDGFELCRELRKRGDANYVPVLMATGLDDLESIE